MRVVRVLVYEAPEKEMKAQLEGSLLSEGYVHQFGHGAGTIREVFRGQLTEPGKVFFMEPEPELQHPNRAVPTKDFEES